MKNLLFALIITISSCSPSRILVVQWVTEDEITCRDEKGIDKKAKNDGTVIFTGDTLIHVGGFRYYNISR